MRHEILIKELSNQSHCDKINLLAVSLSVFQRLLANGRAGWATLLDRIGLCPILSAPCIGYSCEEATLYTAIALQKLGKFVAFFLYKENKQLEPKKKQNQKAILCGNWHFVRFGAPDVRKYESHLCNSL